MDRRSSFQTRRASVLSAKSVRFSADSQATATTATERLQRQAELSLLIEERRPSRPPMIHEDSIEPTFLENFFSRESSSINTSLSRADTGLSPLQAHPGHRVKAFSFELDDEAAGNDWSGAFVKPFSEPSDVENQGDSKREESRFSMVRRIDTGSFSTFASKIQRSASDARKDSHGVRRLYRKTTGRKAIKPGAFRGIEMVSSMATIHASSTLFGRSKMLLDRRALYVLDFDVGTKDTMRE